MTKEQLKKGKLLEALIRYHSFYASDLKGKAKDLQGNISKGNLSPEKQFILDCEIKGTKPEEKELNGEKYVTWKTVQVQNSSYVGIGNANIRPKALVTYLLTEAQYHDQEAKKYERELNRL